jgi:hypothetical protein
LRSSPTGRGTDAPWRQHEKQAIIRSGLAANSHPETAPKFQEQIGKVVTLPELTALVAYATHERRGVQLEPGKR